MDPDSGNNDDSGRGEDGNEHINDPAGRPPARGTTGAEPEGEQPPEPQWHDDPIIPGDQDELALAPQRTPM
eukprot:8597819-Prorocentrum_lima.AAC.1